MGETVCEVICCAKTILAVKEQVNVKGEGGVWLTKNSFTVQLNG